MAGFSFISRIKIGPAAWVFYFGRFGGKKLLNSSGHVVFALSGGSNLVLSWVLWGLVSLLKVSFGYGQRFWRVRVKSLSGKSLVSLAVPSDVVCTAVSGGHLWGCRRR